MRKYFKQQYPYEENKWKIILPISIFILFFMPVFQPFGLSEFQSAHKLLVLTGYGLVTFIILIIDLILIPVVFPKVYSEEKWTVFKEMLNFLLILFTIGLGNLVYSHFYIGFRLTLQNILIFQLFTVAIGIIPVVAIVMIKQSYLNRKNAINADMITSGLHHRPDAETQFSALKIFSEGGKEELEILFDDLLFIKSEGNYISTGYIKKGKMVRSLIRNTMKYAEELLAPFPAAYKCHRSWIVNLDKIEKVSGNSQGLKLTLEGFEEPVPVARNMASDFRQIMDRRTNESSL
ncbi:MAG: LytTR family DNA-binding domain-containing protein [Bacteroidales bacterium]|jgi:hypothetical protein|nr:LytTR family DNA-binding domain-containing protein [Bacteroidales bacterium]